MELENILSRINRGAGNVPAIKRFVKTANRGFRKKSPNDVDKLLRLAVSLFASNDEISAVRLLDFIDKETGEYHCGRRDLAGSLACARLVFVHFLKSKGELDQANEILTLSLIHI